MDTYLDNSKPINLKGTIFICNELCNLSFEYLDSRGMTLSNLNNRLIINYNTSSTIKYNGGEVFGTKPSIYTIVQITVLAPPIHFIDDQRQKMELIITHQSPEKTRYQHLCVLMNPSDKLAARSTLVWKLFDKFANQLPQLNQSNVPIPNVVAWNATDFLPDIADRSFITYNMDTKNNFIVFNQPIDVPTAFFQNFITNIVTQVKYEQLMDIPMPKAPPADIIIFAKKNILEDPDKVAQEEASKEKYVSLADASYDDLNFGKPSPPSDNKDASPAAKPSSATGTTSTPSSDDNDENNSRFNNPIETCPAGSPGGLKWWHILLIIIGILALISGAIIFYWFGGLDLFINWIRSLFNRIPVTAPAGVAPDMVDILFRPAEEVAVDLGIPPRSNTPSVNIQMQSDNEAELERPLYPNNAPPAVPPNEPSLTNIPPIPANLQPRQPPPVPVNRPIPIAPPPLSSVVPQPPKQPLGQRIKNTVGQTKAGIRASLSPITDESSTVGLKTRAALLNNKKAQAELARRAQASTNDDQPDPVVRRKIPTIPPTETSTTASRAAINTSMPELNESSSQTYPSTPVNIPTTGLIERRKKPIIPPTTTTTQTITPSMAQMTKAQARARLQELNDRINSHYRVLSTLNKRSAKPQLKKSKLTGKNNVNKIATQAAINTAGKLGTNELERASIIEKYPNLG